MVTTVAAPAPDQQPAKIGAIGRIFGVLFSPKETFEDIVRKPSWIAPIIFMTLISLTLNIVLAKRVNWVEVSRKQIEKSSFASARFEKLSAEEQTAAYAQQATLAKYGRYVRGVLGVTTLALIGAGVYLLAFNVLGGASIKYSTSFALVCFAYLPVGLRELLGIPIALMKNPDAINPENVVLSNLGALFGSSAPSWQQIMGALVDIFGIWSLVLVAMAFTAAAPKKLTFGKSFGIVLTVFVVFGLIGVGIASIFS